LGSGQTTSCHHPPAHSIDVEALAANPKALHNTEEKKQDRLMMQTGQRPSGCEYCWKIEDIDRDNISDRIYKSKIYPIESLDHAYHLDHRADVDLRTLEIAFDRTCQFACSYCNPAFSSTWVKDIKNNGPYTDLVSDGRNHFTHIHSDSQRYVYGESNPYVDAFFQWWESDLHRTLQELRITGGEPLMSGETWKLIDWFKDNKGRSQTRLAINSNLGPGIDLDRLLESTQDITLDLYTSMESVGAHAEYIRDGLSYSKWVMNMIRLMDSGQLRGLHVMCTINALCLSTLPDLLTVFMRWKKEYGRDFPNFTLNILRFPSFQSPLVLSDPIRTQHKNELQAWLDLWTTDPLLQEHERNHVQRLIDYLDVVKTPHSEAFDQVKLLNDFKQFYRQYDERRGKNFTQTFSRLADWYNLL
jgi:organic radical activating enzyme